MYSSEYLVFVAKQHLSPEHHPVVEKLAAIIPESGKLELSIAEIAHEIGLDENDFAAFFDLLMAVRPQVVQRSGDVLLFDYPEKDVNYVRHIRHAYSNIGLMDPDF